MTVDESKTLKKGTRVYWRGDAASLRSRGKLYLEPQSVPA
jgi:hypothetical protein